MYSPLESILITCARTVLAQLAPSMLAKPGDAPTVSTNPMVDASTRPGRSRVVPVAAHTDAPRGPRVGSFVSQDAPTAPSRHPIMPTVIYRMKTGFDRKVANAQGGINGLVLAAIKDAGRGGITARQIAEGGNINPKSVQSSVYQMRHAHLIESVRVTDRA